MRNFREISCYSLVKFPTLSLPLCIHSIKVKKVPVLHIRHHPQTPVALVMGLWSSINQHHKISGSSSDPEGSRAAAPAAIDQTAGRRMQGHGLLTLCVSMDAYTALFNERCLHMYLFSMWLAKGKPTNASRGQLP